MLDTQPDAIEVNKRLSAFFGCVGTLWRYECSHSKLFIQLLMLPSNPEKVLYVLCNSVERIEASSKWWNNKLQLRESATRKSMIELFDIENRILILTGELRLHEKMPY